MIKSIAPISSGTPADVFAFGTKGIWLDPSDFSTLFQDSTGTTPVTAIGDPIGLITSKGGLASYAIQANTALQPVLAQDGDGYYFIDTNGGKSLTATFNPGLNTTKGHVHYAYRGFGSAHLVDQTINTTYSITHPFAGLVITDWNISVQQLASFKSWSNSKLFLDRELEYAVDEVNGNDSNTGRSPFAPLKTITMNYNVYKSTTFQWRPYGTSYSSWSAYRAARPELDSNSVQLDPQFVDAANGNFTSANVSFPVWAGCERPNLSYTAIPSDETLAAL